MSQSPDWPAPAYYNLLQGNGLPRRLDWLAGQIFAPQASSGAALSIAGPSQVSQLGARRVRWNDG